LFSDKRNFRASAVVYRRRPKPDLARVYRDAALLVQVSVMLRADVAVFDCDVPVKFAGVPESVQVAPPVSMTTRPALS
jgi:hypothetical protein